MVVVTRSRAGRATDRDLRRARATTLKTTKKKKVASAPVGAGIQKRKRPARSSDRAEPPKAAAGKTLAEASFILKLKKEAYGAIDLWKQHRHAPVGALQRWLKAKEKEAKAEEAQPKKTTMVVKTRLSRDFIDLSRMQQPALRKGVPEEYFADKPESFRHRHAMHMYMNSKMHVYHQALIDQYISQGYADDEDEVTTDGEQV